MLLSSTQLINIPVMGLQTGKELARTTVAIINPHNLSVIAYRVGGPHIDADPSYVRTVDIRELGNLGMIIDSSEEFIETDDIITDKPIYDIEFELEDKRVIDKEKNKIGKVIDYVVNVDTFIIEQLVVKRPLLKSFHDDELLIHRDQIVEVTDDTIVIKSDKATGKTKVTASRHYVNPFRQTAPQPETAKTND